MLILFWTALDNGSQADSAQVMELFSMPALPSSSLLSVLSDHQQQLLLPGAAQFAAEVAEPLKSPR